MKIGTRELRRGDRPFIIAEISGNHMGSIDNAIDLISMAKTAGANAVKFQAYTPDTITLNCNKPDFIVQDGIWKGRTLYDLYKAAHTPWHWFPALFKHAIAHDIIAFASVFDPSSVDMLEKLGCPVYKIASFEITDIPLISYAAKTGKPLIISTGLASTVEIEDAQDASNGTAAFLHCTSDYPGTVETADLDRMRRIDEVLGGRNLVGISDHTQGNIIPIAATAMRADIIEKHLKLPNDRKSEDHQFSLTPHEFAVMVREVALTHEALKLRAQPTNGSRQFRRSLYAVKDIAEGETLTEKNVRSIRPGYGMAPKFLSRMLGKKASKVYRKGDRLP